MNHYHNEHNLSVKEIQNEFYPYNVKRIFMCKDCDVEVCKCGWEFGWHGGKYSGNLDSRPQTAYGMLLSNIVNVRHTYPPGFAEDKIQSIINNFFGHESTTNSR